MSDGITPCFSQTAMRAAMVWVSPLPAPPRMSTGPTGAVAGSSWSGRNGVTGGLGGVIIAWHLSGKRTGVPGLRGHGPGPGPGRPRHAPAPHVNLRDMAGTGYRLPAP